MDTAGAAHNTTMSRQTAVNGDVVERLMLCKASDSGNAFCANDVAFWCVADHIERIAGHQRDRRNVRGCENGALQGRDDANLDDPIALHASIDFYVDLVTESEILELAEKAVAMPGEPNVAALREPGGAFDSCGTSVKVH